MTTSPTPEQRPKLRRTAGVVGAGALVVGAAAAVAIPALAQADDEAPQASPVTENVVATEVTPALTPAEQARLRLEKATEAEKAAFVLYTATPEQRAAFALYVATPEERAAFEQFVNPPPPPPPAPPVQAQVQTATKPSTSQGNGAARTTASSGGGGGGNGFLSCVRGRESRGNYGAVNGGSGASGAYQFMPQTWNNTARHAGRSDLVGKNPASASRADQDAMAQHLYSWQGAAPWGGGC